MIARFSILDEAGAKELTHRDLEEESPALSEYVRINYQFGIIRLGTIQLGIVNEKTPIIW